MAPFFISINFKDENRLQLPTFHGLGSFARHRVIPDRKGRCRVQTNFGGKWKRRTTFLFCTRSPSFRCSACYPFEYQLSAGRAMFPTRPLLAVARCAVFEIRLQPEHNVIARKARPYFYFLIRNRSRRGQKEP